MEDGVAMDEEDYDVENEEMSSPDVHNHNQIVDINTE